MKRIYPKQGQTTLDGGLNNKYEKSIIQDNESPDCLNVVFNNGAVATRPGWTKVNTLSIGSGASFVGDGIYTRTDNDGSESMIVFAGGSAFRLGTTTFITIPSAQSIYTAGFRVCHGMQEDHSFFGNGGTVPYKYNGTDWTRHGVYPPTSAYVGGAATMTAVSQGTGGLTGGYQYKLTAVNSALVESDVGPVSPTFTAASATIGVSAIPVMPQSFGVSSRRLYRTVAGGSVFKRIATLSDNTTTTYSDNTPDASLGVTAPADNGVPPNYSTIIYHQYRLFMNDPANPNFVWYSELNQPYTVASTNFFRIGDKTVDLVRGFAVFDNGLICFGDRSITVVYMPSTDPTDWQFVVSKSAYGSKSPFCLVNYNNKVLFPAVQNTKFSGFGAFSGNTTEQNVTALSVLNAGSDLLTDRLEPDMFQVQEGYIQNISGITYQNKIYIALTYGTSQTTNNRIYLMDFSISNISKNQKESWVPWTSTVVNPAQFTIYGGFLYCISSTATGFVYKLSTATYSDDGSAINSYIYTKEFSGYGNEINNHKDFRTLNMLVDQSGAYFMNVTYKTNSEIASGDTQQINISPGGSLWGTMVWGVDVWGGGKYQDKKRVFLGNSNGERIQFKFSNQNTAGQMFKVHWLNYGYNVKGER